MGRRIGDRREQHDADDKGDEQTQDRDLVGTRAERSQEGVDDDPVQDEADHLGGLAGEAVEPEELAQPLRRREPDEEDPVAHLDPTETAAEHRSGQHEERQAEGPVKPESGCGHEQPEDP
jgi:hypothetical protein